LKPTIITRRSTQSLEGTARMMQMLVEKKEEGEQRYVVLHELHP
jgi:outer membrane receptor for ferrienterochelin and colicin